MKRAALYTLIWLAVLWCLAPFLWQIVTSLKSDAEMSALPVTYIPQHASLQHYDALFVRKPFASYLLNSFIISATSTILCVGLSALAAYAVSRLRIRGSRAMLAVLVAISLFPPIIFFFPLYEM